MLPLTYKQQKFSRMQTKMMPEIQAIQKKYQNKKDQASVMKQNEEIQQVYDKYGTSMTGGCLPLLIQMPFLFALYPVIYNIQDLFPSFLLSFSSLTCFSRSFTLLQRFPIVKHNKDTSKATNPIPMLLSRNQKLNAIAHNPKKRAQNENT